MGTATTTRTRRSVKDMLIDADTLVPALLLREHKPRTVRLATAENLGAYFSPSRARPRILYTDPDHGPVRSLDREADVENVSRAVLRLVRVGGDPDGLRRSAADLMARVAAPGTRLHIGAAEQYTDPDAVRREILEPLRRATWWNPRPCYRFDDEYAAPARRAVRAWQADDPEGMAAGMDFSVRRASSARGTYRRVLAELALPLAERGGFEAGPAQRDALRLPADTSTGVRYVLALARDSGFVDDGRAQSLAAGDDERIVRALHAALAG